MNANIVIAFDTASENIALALGRWDAPALSRIELIASDDHPAVRQANVQLMPSIEKLLKENGLEKSGIACVVCGLGPGSFTGVRIGVATAKGIARGLGIPLYGVSTLDAVAWGAWANGIRGSIAVIADAMRGEVYPARFNLSDEEVHRLDHHTVSKAEQVAKQWKDDKEHLLIFGDGLKKYYGAFSDAFSSAFSDASSDGTSDISAEAISDSANYKLTIGEESLWTPTGRGLLLAFEAACRDKTQGSGEAGTLLPIYTRLSDAEENERKRLASGGQITQGAVVNMPRSGVTDPVHRGEVVYRPMAFSDLEQVSILEAESFQGGSAVSGESWTYEMFADELACKDRAWWVAYAEDLLVGFAGALILDGSLQILDICVAEPYRRHGIARQLFDHLIGDGVDLGATKATLEVRESNEAALSLYLSLGFKQIGIRPDYYSPNEGIQRENAIVMEKSLLDIGDKGSLSYRNAMHYRSLLGGRISLNNKGATDQEALSERDALSQSDGTASVGPFDSAVPVRPLDSAVPAGPLDSAKPAGSLESACSIAPQDSDSSVRSLPGCTLGSLIPPVILAIETSCDETAVSIINGEGVLLSDVVASQVDFHARFGGVVPEIASRKHTEAIVGVVDAAMEEVGLNSWRDLSAISVTYAPGLVGALVVGLAFAKGLSWATDLPLIRVNHLEGHIYANRFAQEDQPIEPPFVIALLSGGHTMLVHTRAWGDYHVMGQTLDDAVGEAFDKVAKALGLGYPGGPIIAKLAEQGDPKAVDFPRALLHSHDYRFSLSGLKTAVITYIKKEQDSGRELNLPDIAASFQQAVIDVQISKALAALEESGCKTFCIGGGVAANKALRDAYVESMGKRGIHVVLPPKTACTDNAAMIALVAIDRYKDGRFMDLADDAYAHTDFEEPY